MASTKSNQKILCKLQGHTSEKNKERDTITYKKINDGKYNLIVDLDLKVLRIPRCKNCGEILWDEAST